VFQVLLRPESRESSQNPPEQLEIKKKVEKTRFHVPASSKIGQYCTGKTKDAGTPEGRSPRALITSEEARVSTLGLHRGMQAINKSCIQKRRQRATLGYPKMHSQWHRLAAVDARSGRAALVKVINESPEFACHAFVSKASKKGVDITNGAIVALLEMSQHLEVSRSL
jgi:hypothetical protein